MSTELKKAETHFILGSCSAPGENKNLTEGDPRSWIFLTITPSFLFTQMGNPLTGFPWKRVAWIVYSLHETQGRISSFNDLLVHGATSIADTYFGPGEITPALK